MCPYAGAYAEAVANNLIFYKDICSTKNKYCKHFPTCKQWHECHFKIQFCTNKIAHGWQLCRNMKETRSILSSSATFSSGYGSDGWKIWSNEWITMGEQVLSWKTSDKWTAIVILQIWHSPWRELHFSTHNTNALFWLGCWFWFGIYWS